MTRTHLGLATLATACLAALVGPAACAELSYSGDDVAAGPGTLTVHCADGKHDLWKLDLVRPDQTDELQIRRFDDLTDEADFDYSPPPENSDGLFQAHSRRHLTPGSLVELHRGPGRYEWAVREDLPGCTALTTYRLEAATAEGTRIVATRTLVNTSGKPLHGTMGMMNARMSLGVSGFDGRPKGANCRLADYDDNGRMLHVQPDGSGALWVITDNVSRNRNPTFDATAPIWAEATILDSPAAGRVGLVPGRTFRLDSDIVAYYPAAIGGIVLDKRVDYTEALNINFAPREWLGSSRQDQQAGLPADGQATKTFTLRINIAAGEAGE